MPYVYVPKPHLHFWKVSPIPVDIVARVTDDELGRVPSSYLDLVNLAARYARERLAGRTVVNRATQLAVTMPTNSLGAATQIGAPRDLLQAVPALPAMLSYGRYVRTVTNPQRRADVRRRHLLAATVEVAGRPVEALLLVRENFGGQCFFERMAERRLPLRHRDAGGATPDDAPDPSAQQDSGTSPSDPPDVASAVSVADAGPAQLSARDKAYLDKYYDLVNEMSKKYFVDPALVLATGAESGYGTSRIFNDDNDAFGMSGGRLKTQPHFPSYDANVRAFFNQYGPQIWGTDSDAQAFKNALQGRDAAGVPVTGWKRYNSERPAGWMKMMDDNIPQMRRDIPRYLQQRNGG